MVLICITLLNKSAFFKKLASQMHFCIKALIFFNPCTHKVAASIVKSVSCPRLTVSYDSTVDL